MLYILCASVYLTLSSCQEWKKLSKMSVTNTSLQDKCLLSTATARQKGKICQQGAARGQGVSQIAPSSM